MRKTQQAGKRNARMPNAGPMSGRSATRVWDRDRKGGVRADRRSAQRNGAAPRSGQHEHAGRGAGGGRVAWGGITSSGACTERERRHDQRGGAVATSRWEAQQVGRRVGRAMRGPLEHGRAEGEPCTWHNELVGHVWSAGSRRLTGALPDPTQRTSAGKAGSPPSATCGTIRVRGRDTMGQENAPGYGRSEWAGGARAKQAQRGSIGGQPPTSEQRSGGGRRWRVPLSRYQAWHREVEGEHRPPGAAKMPQTSPCEKRRRRHSGAQEQRLHVRGVLRWQPGR
ncbi:hypothetical protein B0H11DRAFT_2385233 [Mycena galericulata]|nr:hypothetical protein B0H11DRAFT_2385233 [Mycena galericulata]